MSKNITAIAPTTERQPVVHNAPPTAAPNTQEQDFKRYIGEAQGFGNADGKGKKAYVSFGRVVVEGAVNGALDDRIKTDQPHHVQMYTAFADASLAAADGIGHVETAQSAKSRRVQEAKVKALIRFGRECKDYALQVFDLAQTIHRDMVKNKIELKYPSTYTALVNIATTSYSKEYKGTPLNEATIRELFKAPQRDTIERTGADLLIEAIRFCDSAVKGKSSSEGTVREPVVHPELPDVILSLRSVVYSLDAAKLDDYDKDKKAKEDAAAERKSKADEKAREKQAKKDEAAKKNEEAARKAALANEGLATIDPDEDDQTDEDDIDEDEMEDTE